MTNSQLYHIPDVSSPVRPGAHGRNSLARNSIDGYYPITLLDSGLGSGTVSRYVLYG